MLVICIQNHVLCLLWLNEGPLLHEVSKNAYFHLGRSIQYYNCTYCNWYWDFISRGSTLFQYLYTLLVNKACRVYRNCCLSISLQTWFCTIQFTADMILFNSCTVLAYVAFGPNWQGLLGLNEHNIKVSSLIGRPRTGHAQVNLCFRISLYTTKTQTPTDLTFYLMTE